MDHCLLGRNFSMERRKRDARCFNGYDYEHKVVGERAHCACDFDHDVQCEFGCEHIPCRNRLLCSGTPLVTQVNISTSSCLATTRREPPAVDADHALPVQRCSYARAEVGDKARCVIMTGESGDRTCPGTLGDRDWRDMGDRLVNNDVCTHPERVLAPEPSRRTSHR